MKKMYVFLFFITTFCPLYSQIFQWAKSEGLWAYDYGYGIANDSAGNIYLAGKYEEEAIFSGITLPNQGNHDIYLAQYSPSGTLNWIRTAGGPLGDYATALSCDGSDFVYIAGEIEGDYLDISFVGTSTTLTCIGHNDIFLAKYDLGGNLIWAKQAGWWLNEKALGITHDNAGNVYICGYFNDTTYFNGSQILGYGMNDIFLAKYDASGNYQWVRKAGGKGRDEAKSVKCDAFGNLYVCGMFKDTAVFGNQTVIAPNGFFNMFLAKYDSTGNLLWLKTHGADYDDVGWSLTLDDAGKVYVAGEFNDYVYFDSIPLETSGGADAFVACYNSSGNVLWAKKGGGNLNDRARGMGTDGRNIYITGQFGATAVFGDYSITATDSADIFIAAIDSAANFSWIVSAGGSPDVYEELGYESGNAVCAYSDGSVYATGALLDNGIFGGNSVTAWDRTDVFLTKISQGCTSPPPQPGTISGTSTVCEGSSNTFSIDAVNGAKSYSWILPSGWIGNSATTSISTLADSAGGYISVTANNSCGSSPPVYIAVTVNQSPTTADAGPDQDICTTSATLSANTPAVGTGIWSVLTGSATITDPASPVSDVTGLSIGSNTLRWTVGNSSCPSSTDEVVITCIQSPTVADAGPDQDICTTSATLSANTPAVGTGIWSVITGSATITDPASPVSAVTDLAIGSNMLQWTISSSGCASSTDEVVIVRTQSPTLIINAEKDILCEKEEIVLHGQGAATYLWMPGGLTGDSLSIKPDSTITYFLTGTNESGCTETVSLTLTVVECVSITESIVDETVMIFPNPGRSEFRLIGGTFPAHISIFNFLGQRVYGFIAETGNLCMVLPPGIYMAEIATPDKIRNKKLLVVE